MEYTYPDVNFRVYLSSLSTVSTYNKKKLLKLLTILLCLPATLCYTEQALTRAWKLLFIKIHLKPTWEYRHLAAKIIDFLIWPETILLDRLMPIKFPVISQRKAPTFLEELKKLWSKCSFFTSPWGLRLLDSFFGFHWFKEIHAYKFLVRLWI